MNQEQMDTAQSQALCAEHGPHTSDCPDPCVHDGCNDAHPARFAFYPADRNTAQPYWGEAETYALAREGAARLALRLATPYVVTERYVDVDGTLVESELSDE